MTGKTADGRIETVRIVPDGSDVANYAFDVTPARLVTGLITERGVIAANRDALAAAFPERAKLRAMTLAAKQPLELPVDGRQSETALAVARGTARLLHAHGFSVVSELPLPSGRRADLVALDAGGEIWIVEIKSSVADFRADQKWQDYRAPLRPAVFCDAYGNAT